MSQNFCSTRYIHTCTVKFFIGKHHSFNVVKMIIFDLVNSRMMRIFLDSQLENINYLELIFNSKAILNCKRIVIQILVSST